jgi:hypothetical protein
VRELKGLDGQSSSNTEERLMKRKKSSELQAVETRFRHWRQQRTSRSQRIPEELWSEAVRVGSVEGVSFTARVLRLDYCAFCERVEQARPGAARVGSQLAVSEAAGSPAFVQVQVPDSECGAGIVIELTARDGDRMRIEARDAVRIDVTGMVQAFWSRAS